MGIGNRANGSHHARQITRGAACAASPVLQDQPRTNCRQSGARHQRKNDLVNFLNTQIRLDLLGRFEVLTAARKSR
jgi:hypothetical protein